MYNMTFLTLKYRDQVFVSIGQPLNVIQSFLSTGALNLNPQASPLSHCSRQTLFLLSGVMCTVSCSCTRYTLTLCIMSNLGGHTYTRCCLHEPEASAEIHSDYIPDRSRPVDPGEGWSEAYPQASVRQPHHGPL